MTSFSHLGDELRDKIEQVGAICRRRRVRKLALFGSAARGDFVPSASDLDFVVEFQPMSPRERADHYFGLLKDLERLFAAPVDVVEVDAIRNPYFRRSVETSQVVVYEAA